MNDWVAKLQRIYNITTSIEALCSEMTQRMVTLINAGRVKAQPGAHEIIQYVADQKIPCAIASSSPLAIINASITAQGWADKITVRCSGEEVALGKPAPDVYLLAAKRLGVDATSCISLEDR